MWDTIRIIEASAAGLLVLGSVLVARAISLAEAAVAPRRRAHTSGHRRRRDDQRPSEHPKAA